LLCAITPRAPRTPPVPYTTLFRSQGAHDRAGLQPPGLERHEDDVGGVQGGRGLGGGGRAVHDHPLERNSGQASELGGVLLGGEGVGGVGLELFVDFGGAGLVGVGIDQEGLALVPAEEPRQAARGGGLADTALTAEYSDDAGSWSGHGPILSPRLRGTYVPRK